MIVRKQVHFKVLTKKCTEVQCLKISIKLKQCSTYRSVKTYASIAYKLSAFGKISALWNICKIFNNFLNDFLIELFFSEFSTLYSLSWKQQLIQIFVAQNDLLNVFNLNLNIFFSLQPRKHFNQATFLLTTIMLTDYCITSFKTYQFNICYEFHMV